LGVHLSQVACAQPAVFVSWPIFARLPITCGDVLAAYQNFAVVRQPEFTPGQNLADGALRRAKRMIEADERSRFGHTVTLHHGIADSLKKILGVRCKRGTAANESPKLPPQAPVNAAKAPN